MPGRASQTEPAITGSKMKRSDCISHSRFCEDQRDDSGVLHSRFNPNNTWHTREVWWESAGSLQKKSHHQISGSNAVLPLLSALSAVCLVDTGIWWALIVAVQRWFTNHVITQVPSPGLPQEESAPRAPRRKELSVRRGKELWTQEDFHQEAIYSNVIAEDTQVWKFIFVVVLIFEIKSRKKKSSLQFLKSCIYLHKMIIS